MTRSSTCRVDTPGTYARVLAQLHEAGEDRDLSVNYLVVKAVEEFLPRLVPATEFRLTRPLPESA